MADHPQLSSDPHSFFRSLVFGGACRHVPPLFRAHFWFSFVFKFYGSGFCAWNVLDEAFDFI